MKLARVALDGTKAALEAEAHAAGCSARQPKAQRNSTDPDSCIMKSGRDFVQGYDAQAAVDHAAQVIVAQIKRNTGRQVEELSADAG